MWNIGAKSSQDSARQHMIPKIPNYQIIKPLGEGGMGIIYLAEQLKPIKRQVALKVIKPGMDTRRVLSRFEAERQLLAMLEHPNIARIYNAGMTDIHLPYFAMEYVDGIPVTTYCDRERLNIEERLKLFIQICQAIHHAHQKGIIHRDIKPSNILVTIQDGKPVPKIIDFGIAKAIGKNSSEHTMYTQEGQIIGTPEYMSPEQLGLRNQDIDTRSDIYSLGILLYELLTGTLPFNSKTLRKAAINEVQKIICEQEPPRPSTIISHLGTDAEKIVENRRMELISLIKCLHKELEWIPLMAIRKEREQRYKSVSEFAEDVQRYLDGNPLMAGPESLKYRVGKFVKRNRGPVFASLLIIFTLIAGVVFSLYFAVGQYSAKKEADISRQHAEGETQRAIKEAFNAQQASYYNSISLADSAIKQNNVLNAKIVLENCPEVFRNWEWYHLWNQLDMSSMTIRGHMDEVTSVLFSNDDKYIFSGSLDGIIRQWDVDTGKELKSFNHKGKVSSIALSPDGQFIASNGLEATRIKIWDTKTGENIKIIYYNADFGSNTIGFTPSGDLLAIKGHTVSPPIYSFDGNNWDELYKFSTNHGYHVTSMSILPDGQYVSTASEGGSVKIFDLLTKKQVTSFQENEGKIYSVAFSHNGKYIVYSGDVVKLWDFEKEKLLKVFKDHSDTVNIVAFSPQDNILASGSADNTIKLWDVDSGEEIVTLRGHSNSVQTLAFSSDGKFLVSGSKDKTIKLWNIDDVFRNTLVEKKPVLLCASLSPDGKVVAAGGDDGSILISNAIMGGNQKVIIDKNPVTSIAFSSDGDYIIAGLSTGLIKVYQASTGKIVSRFQGAKSTITSLYAYNAKTLLGGTATGEILSWDLSTGQEAFSFKAHLKQVTSVYMNSGGTFIVSGGDEKIKIWNAKSKELYRTLGDNEEYIFDAKIYCPGDTINGEEITDPNASFAIWHSKDGFKIWDLTKDKSSLMLGGQNDTVLRDVSTANNIMPSVKLTKDSEIEYTSVFSFDNDGEIIYQRKGTPLITWGDDSKTVAISSQENTIKVINLLTNEAVIVPSGQCVTKAFSYDSEHNIIAYPDKSLDIYDDEESKFSDRSFIVIYDTKSKDTIGSFGESCDCDILMFSPTKEDIIASHDGEIRMWDIKTGFEIQRFAGHSKYIRSIDCSSDGRFLVSGSVDTTIRIWDIETGNVIKTLSGHNGIVNTVSFSNVGKYIASGSDDEIIIVWDVETGNKIQEFHGHDGKIWSVSFSPDGTRLVSGSGDKTMKLWSIDTGTEVLTIKDLDKQEIATVSFSPNGRYIAYGNTVGAVRLLDSSTPDMVHEELLEETRMLDLIETYNSQKPVKEVVPVYKTNSNNGFLGAIYGCRGGSSGKNVPSNNSIENLCIDKDFKYFTGAWAMKLPSGFSNSVPLTNKPQELIIREPDYSSNRIYYGCFNLGNAEDNKFTFALDKTSSDETVLYVDKNNNEDLTDDGEPLKNIGHWLFVSDVELEVVVISQAGEKINRPYNLRFWIKDNQGQLQAQYRCNCYYKAYIMGYLAVSYEHSNPDALYQDQGLWIDLNKDYMLDFTKEHFNSGDTVTINKKQYQLNLDYP